MAHPDEHDANGYRRGCRCRLCKRAQADQRARYAWSDWRVKVTEDAEEIRVHVQKLKDRGMPLEVIARKAEVTTQTLYRLIYGTRSDPPSQTIRSDKAARIWNVEFHPMYTKDGVFAVGTLRRLRALHRKGWPWARIARETGVGTSTIREVINGTLEVVSLQTHERIARFYTFNWLRFGGSPQAVERARQQHFPPPGAWVGDIDDPAQVPDKQVFWA